MTFTETSLRGTYIVDLQPIRDERGFFARGWCRKEFDEHGLNANLAQINIGYSRRKGTLRGLHFQRAPYAEVKLVRCTRGAIYDVVVDLRPESSTFRQWVAVELTAENHRMLYVAEGCAQGYQTLADDTEMCYQTSQFFVPAAAHGVQYDDPSLNIGWPLPVSVISDSDKNWPLLG